MDTQTVLWWSFEPARLGWQTRRLIDQAWIEEDAAVSTISFWETAMLHAKGRIAFTADVSLWRQYLLDNGLHEIAVDGIIAVAAGSLDYPRGDPADRLIIATAMLGGHQLVTTDRDILAWSGPLRRRRAAD